MAYKAKSLAVIPPALEKSVTPKPSKAEIIDALTSLHIDELIKQSRIEVERRKELEPLIEQNILNLAASAEMEVDSYGWVNGDRASGARVSIKIENLPKELELMVVEHDKLHRSVVIPDERKVRKEIAERVNGSLSRTERVDAMLSDPQSNASLKSLLSQITDAKR